MLQLWLAVAYCCSLFTFVAGFCVRGFDCFASCFVWFWALVKKTEIEEKAEPLWDKRGYGYNAHLQEWRRS